MVETLNKEGVGSPAAARCCGHFGIECNTSKLPDKCIHKVGIAISSLADDDDGMLRQILLKKYPGIDGSNVDEVKEQYLPITASWPKADVIANHVVRQINSTDEVIVVLVGFGALDVGDCMMSGGRVPDMPTARLPFLITTVNGGYNADRLTIQPLDADEVALPHISHHTALNILRPCLCLP